MQFLSFRYENVWWCVFVVAFLAAFLLETVRPFRALESSTPWRWISNGALLAVTSVLTRFAYVLTGVALAAAEHGSRYGLLNRMAIPYVLRFLIGFLSLDLAQYLVHRLHHATFLWRVHQIHHSESDLDVTTGLRFHPGEALVSQSGFLIVIALLGVPPSAVIAATLVILIQDFFTHANLVMPASADHALRWVIVTPGMHRTHHSDIISDQNTNFGTIFSIWDRCFGTYLSEPSMGANCRCGLTELRDGSSLNLFRLLALPFRRG